MTETKDRLEQIHDDNRILATKVKEVDKLKNDLALATAQLKKSQERVIQITEKITELIGIG